MPVPGPDSSLRLAMTTHSRERGPGKWGGRRGALGDSFTLTPARGLSTTKAAPGPPVAHLVAGAPVAPVKPVRPAGSFDTVRAGGYDARRTRDVTDPIPDATAGPPPLRTSF